MRAKFVIEHAMIKLRVANGGSMAQGGKNRCQLRMMCVLTLISFFYFSGLNNGFSYFAVSSAGVTRIDFGPAVASQIVHLFNPFYWQKTILNKAALQRLFKSQKVIQYASQRAIQNMLVESNLLQVWLLQSCDQWMKSSATAAGQHKKQQIASSPFAFAIQPIDEAMEPPFPLPGFRVHSLYKLNLMPQPSKRYGLNFGPGYMQMGKKEQWLLNRPHLWDGSFFKLNLGPQGTATFHSLVLLGPPGKRLVHSFLKPPAWRAGLWKKRVVFSKNSDEDDSSGSQFVRQSAMSPGSWTPGDFILSEARR